MYPPSPSTQDFSFLQPTPEFTRHVRGSIIGIILFFLFYLFLIGFGIFLLFLCGFAAIGLLSLSVNKITIVLGLGLVGLGLMFFAFLFKFIFAIKKDEDQSRVEIKRLQHPALFEFIDKLTDEVKAPRPKKIFLSPEVNAYVFYNSSFWSMFLPVRKNLNIGLGLVNSLNISEFKAVMAHEFGHFSQRSMKVGSYVYIVNRVIYNLVYEYDRWDKLLVSWAESGGLWSIFAKITDLLVGLVRRLLQKAYELLNVQYMKLSREMEYQADLVAVSATGGQAAISALRRVGFGDMAYQQAINHLNMMVSEAKKSPNVYSLQTEVMLREAAEKHMPVDNSLPVITEEVLQSLAPSNRVNFKNQWASHPDQEDREANILRANVSAPISAESPWQLFNQPEQLQQEFTNRLYEGITPPENTTWNFAENAEVFDVLNHKINQAKLPEAYHEFYTRRFLNLFVPNEVAASLSTSLDFNAIFSPQTRQRMELHFTNLQDLETLQQIQSKAIKVKSFDFDGDKYDVTEIGAVIKKLEDEISAQKEWYQQIDQDAFGWHYQNVASDEQQLLLNDYALYFELAEINDEFLHSLQQYYQLIVTIQQSASGGDVPTEVLYKIDPVYEPIEALWNRCATVALPVQLESESFEHGLTAYLLKDPLQRVSGGTFDWDNMVVLFRQLETITKNMEYVVYIYLQHLIKKQARLVGIV